jgi:hypothetical protein
VAGGEGPVPPSSSVPDSTPGSTPPESRRDRGTERDGRQQATQSPGSRETEPARRDHSPRQNAPSRSIPTEPDDRTEENGDRRIVRAAPKRPPEPEVRQSPIPPGGVGGDRASPSKASGEGASAPGNGGTDKGSAVRTPGGTDIYQESGVGAPRQAPSQGQGSATARPSPAIQSKPARLISFRGAVTVRRSLNGPAITPVIRGLLLPDGYVVMTGANGLASLRFPDGELISLNQDTTVELAPEPDRIRVHRGRVRMRVPPRPRPQDFIERPRGRA